MKINPSFIEESVTSNNSMNLKEFLNNVYLTKTGQSIDLKIKN
jgi:hypothetical protein